MTMRALVAVALSLAAACSYTFDDSEPDLPLVGEKPGTYAVPKLNESPATSRVTVIRGYDNAQWGAWTENVTEPGTSRIREALRLVKIFDPSQRELRFADEFSFGSRAIFTLDKPKKEGDPTILTIRAAGEPGPGQVFELEPSEKSLLSFGGRDVVFYYWVASPETTDFLVQRTDRAFSRRIPLPEGASPTDPPGRVLLWFDGAGDLLFVRDADGNVVRHNTKSEDSRDFGKTGRIIAIDNGRKNFLTCDEEGLQQVDYADAEHHLLDPTPCLGLAFFLGDKIYYGAEDGLRRVPFTGMGEPERVQLPGRVITWANDNLFAYSTDPSDRYIEGAGNGFVGDWKFMERGLEARFSRDRKKIYWLENAAKLSGIGDLRSAMIPIDRPAERPTQLARNVWTWEETDDQRILAIENRAFRGEFNRLVIIDEAERTRRWVAEGAVNYLRISPTDILVERWGPLGQDVIVVKLPPKVEPAQ
jgi:hypothetical protein